MPDIEAAVRAIASDSSLRNAQVGMAILDVDSGKLLAATGEHVPLNPASNAKLFTAAAALALLHPEHRFETTLSGAARGATVSGPLILRGYGDPSLTAADLFALALELRTYGIRRIDGDILVDQRFFDEQTTPPAFEQQPDEWSYFRAPVSAVAVHENCVVMTARPGGAGGPALLSFDPPGFVDIEGSVTTASKGADTVTLTLAPRGQRLVARVGGAISEDSRLVRYTKRVEDPTLLAGYALRAMLERAEIKVTGDVKAGTAKARVLARHQSAPLSALLYAVGKNSNNFYAEMIFKALGGEAKGRPAKSADGAEQAQRWLERVGASDQGMVLKNGSGLFDANRVTAWSVVQLLRVAWLDRRIQPEFLAQLAVGGVDGTLHKRFRSERTRRYVRAKTGTLGDTIALSGYLLGQGTRGPIAFSLLFNKVAGKQDGARAAADKLVEILARKLHP
jgi:D-alanyl-D-alanine carboxypeptidase/D-alanyl-D-alanine-endopeptidase (penicillin-binding protein 4)